MNLDDLKDRWTELDRKLDASLRLNTRLLNARKLDRAATALRRLSWFLWFELALDAVLLVWLGSYLVDHMTQLRFVLPGGVLYGFVIAYVVLIVQQLVGIARLDYDGQVVEIQKRMETLRIWRLRATKMVFLLAPLLWAALLVVVPKSLIGLDVYAACSVAWLAANFVFGVAVIPVAVWISRRYADRMERSPLVQRIMRDLAGYNLNAALNSLESIKRFEDPLRPSTSG